jgi:hypothetical protein
LECPGFVLPEEQLEQQAELWSGQRRKLLAADNNIKDIARNATEN